MVVTVNGADETNSSAQSSHSGGNLDGGLSRYVEMYADINITFWVRDAYNNGIPDIQPQQFTVRSKFGPFTCGGGLSPMKDEGKKYTMKLSDCSRLARVGRQTLTVDQGIQGYNWKKSVSETY